MQRKESRTMSTFLRSTPGVCLLTLSVLVTLTDGDAEASCVFRESCILPCSFQTGNDVVIHWIQVATGNYIHSYYHNQDQLARQDQRFKGRTSLFKDQIFRGNTSLQLTGVEVQDQGRYKCFTSTIRGNKESSINLKVDAPVHKVNIQQVENRITCSSEGIYPEPELTWSTKPPSALTFENTTTVQQTDQQLYNINSSLILSDSVTDLVYSCNVSTDRNWRRATLFKPTSLNVSDTEATIFCTSSNTPLLGLVWRFNSQIILNRIRDDASFTVSEGWRQQVKGVSGSGSLTLQDLSSNQEGTYTCELSDDEETYITNIMVKIQGEPTSVGGIIVWVIAAIFVTGGAAVVGLTVHLCFINKREDPTRVRRITGIIRMMVTAIVVIGQAAVSILSIDSYYIMETVDSRSVGRITVWVFAAISLTGVAAVVGLRVHLQIIIKRGDSTRVKRTTVVVIAAIFVKAVTAVSGLSVFLYYIKEGGDPTRAGVIIGVMMVILAILFTAEAAEVGLTVHLYFIIKTGDPTGVRRIKGIMCMMVAAIFVKGVAVVSILSLCLYFINLREDSTRVGGIIGGMVVVAILFTAEASVVGLTVRLYFINKREDPTRVRRITGIMCMMVAALFVKGVTAVSILSLCLYFINLRGDSTRVGGIIVVVVEAICVIGVTAGRVVHLYNIYKEVQQGNLRRQTNNSNNDDPQQGTELGATDGGRKGATSGENSTTNPLLMGNKDSNGQEVETEVAQDE